MYAYAGRFSLHNKGFINLFTTLRRCGEKSERGKSRKRKNRMMRSNAGTSLDSEYRKQLSEWIDIGLLHRFKMARTGSSWVVAGLGVLFFARV